MKKITHFERDDGMIFGRNENGTFSTLPRDENHINHEWSEECLLSHRPVIQPVYEKCGCHLCTQIIPRVERIQAALTSDELKADLEYIMNAYGADSLDKDVAEAMLAGEWPGWEWMKEAKAKQHEILSTKL